MKKKLIVICGLSILASCSDNIIQAEKENYNNTGFHSVIQTPNSILVLPNSVVQFKATALSDDKLVENGLLCINVAKYYNGKTEDICTEDTDLYLTNGIKKLIHPTFGDLTGYLIIDSISLKNYVSNGDVKITYGAENKKELYRISKNADIFKELAVVKFNPPSFNRLIGEVHGTVIISNDKIHELNLANNNSELGYITPLKEHGYNLVYKVEVSPNDYKVKNFYLPEPEFNIKNETKSEVDITGNIWISSDDSSQDKVIPFTIKNYN